VADKELWSLIQNNWRHIQEAEESACTQFVASLITLKEKVGAWARAKHIQQEQELQTVEKELEKLYD